MALHLALSTHLLASAFTLWEPMPLLPSPAGPLQLFPHSLTCLDLLSPSALPSSFCTECLWCQHIPGPGERSVGTLSQHTCPEAKGKDQLRAKEGDTSWCGLEEGHEGQCSHVTQARAPPRGISECSRTPSVPLGPCSHGCWS